MTDMSWDVVWCYFRNALRSAYREIRHLGTAHDSGARAVAPTQYSKQADLCRSNRERLKSSVPYRSVKTSSTAGYIQAYEVLTDLNPEDLSTLFRTASWQPGYGGEKWAAITDAIIELARAIDSRDITACQSLCTRLRKVYHNNGPLIPSQKKWDQDSWQREKWPELCEPE